MVVVDGTDRLREGAKVELVVRDTPAQPAADAGRLGPRNGKGGDERPPGALNPRAKDGA
jgi:hypothetical protein